MDCSGNIHHFKEEEQKPKHMMPVSNKEVQIQKRRSYSRRKSWMRNQKCPCSSGKKYKKCCWSKNSKAFNQELFDNRYEVD